MLISELLSWLNSLLERLFYVLQEYCLVLIATGLLELILLVCLICVRTRTGSLSYSKHCLQLKNDVTRLRFVFILIVTGKSSYPVCTAHSAEPSTRATLWSATSCAVLSPPSFLPKVQTTSFLSPTWVSVCRSPIKRPATANANHRKCYLEVACLVRESLLHQSKWWFNPSSSAKAAGFSCTCQRSRPLAYLT